jgi:hypothetical protein
MISSIPHATLWISPHGLLLFDMLAGYLLLVWMLWRQTAALSSPVERNPVPPVSA